MPETFSTMSIHLIRPWWLLLIPVSILLHLHLRKSHNTIDRWRSAIAAHLLPHLGVGAEGGRRVRPYQLLTVVLVVASVALAGPAWERELTPFTEDRAPLVVAIKLTPSMLSVDQQPTRLVRAKQKLRDLLAARQGARTAVVAYAGSAHAVLPLTDDVQLLEIYLESLAPEVMPQDGDAPDAALLLAEQMLASESATGTIVFMTDGIDRTLEETFANVANRSDDQIILWAFGTEQGGPIQDSDDLAVGVDDVGLRTIATAAGGTLVSSTIDGADVDRVMNKIRTNLVSAIEENENLRWHDAGYYLVWPLALLVLIWSRRGWTVVWT
jgi:Ca-activated chloride channel family protein